MSVSSTNSEHSVASLPDDALLEHVAVEEWMKRNLKVVNKRDELVSYAPNKVQQIIYKVILMQRRAGKPARLIVLKSRREGVSTGVAAYFFTRTRLKPYHGSFVSAHDSEGCKTQWNIVKRFEDNLSRDAKLPIKKSDATELRYEHPHGSSYRVQTAGNENMGSGAGYTDVHLSELAKWSHDKAAMTSIMQTVPDGPHTTVIIESTANGAGGLFYEMWNAAVQRQRENPGDLDGFIPIFFTSLTPEHSTQPPDNYDWGMLDEDEVEWRKVGATDAQLYWRRITIENKCGGDVNQFKQEYPLCVTAETRVSTDLGIIRIDSAGTAKDTESGAVSRWGPQPASEIFKLTTKRGRVLRGTHNHPIALVDGGFGNLSALQPGQRVVLRPPMFAKNYFVRKWNPLPGVEHRVDITEDWGAFIGMFMGDGSWHKDDLSIVCDAEDQDVVEQGCGLVARLFATPRTRNISRVQGRKGATEIRLGCKAARDALIACGLVGRKDENSWKRTVCVPEVIWQSPKPVVREFLRWLFECDGSASCNKVRFATCKEPFARDIQLLLLGFGINATMHYDSKVAGNGSNYSIYTLDLGVEASRLFHQEIGFVGKRKSSLVPQECSLGRPPQPNEMADEVATVEKDGFEVTYDFTIGDAHVFSANGILTHNTPEEAFLTSGRPAIETAITKNHRSMVIKPRRARLVWDAREACGVRIEYGDFRDSECGWDIWQEPQPDMDYTVGCDTCTGIPTDPEDKGSDPDFHSIYVLRREPRRFIACHHSRIDADRLGREALKAARYWNMAWATPELAGGSGVTVLNAFLADAYPRIYHRECEADASDLSEVHKLGWKTTKATRNGMIDDWIAACRKDPDLGWQFTLQVPDENLIEEEETFIWNGDKREHRPGAHDDRLFAAMIALQLDKRCIRTHRFTRVGVQESRPFSGPQYVGGIDLGVPEERGNVEVSVESLN